MTKQYILVCTTVVIGIIDFKSNDYGYETYLYAYFANDNIMIMLNGTNISKIYNIKTCFTQIYTSNAYKSQVISCIISADILNINSVHVINKCKIHNLFFSFTFISTL